MKKYKASKLFQFLFPFFFIIGIVIVYFGFNDRKIVNLGYKEDNSVKYNVYLKKNDFFEEPYLGEGKTYIASLIDYIDVSFHHDITYDKNFNGDSTYKLVAVVSANKPDANGYYWQREYNLSEEKEVKIHDKNRIVIDDNVKVNYSLYNDILAKFKKEYSLTTDGELKIVMRINSKAKFYEIKEPVDSKSEINISIPLLEQALDVSINKDVSNDRATISFVEANNSPIYLIMKIIGTIFIIFSIAGFVVVTKAAKDFKMNNLYLLKLNKILKNYDGIIANAKSLPDIKGFKVVEISTFEELLDVYNEVRMPINCYQERNRTTFIIINDTTAWIYILRKSSLFEES